MCSGLRTWVEVHRNLVVDGCNTSWTCLAFEAFFSSFGVVSKAAHWMVVKRFRLSTCQCSFFLLLKNPVVLRIWN